MAGIWQRQKPDSPVIDFIHRDDMYAVEILAYINGKT